MTRKNPEKIFKSKLSGLYANVTPINCKKKSLVNYVEEHLLVKKIHRWALGVQIGISRKNLFGD